MTYPDSAYNYMTNNKYAGQGYKPPILPMSPAIMKAISDKFDIPYEDGMMFQGCALVGVKPL